MRGVGTNSGKGSGLAMRVATAVMTSVIAAATVRPSFSVDVDAEQGLGGNPECHLHDVGHNVMLAAGAPLLTHGLLVGTHDIGIKGDLLLVERRRHHAALALPDSPSLRKMPSPVAGCSMCDMTSFLKELALWTSTSSMSSGRLTTTPRIGPMR